MNSELRKVLEENGVDRIKYYVVSSPIINNVFTTCVFINDKKGVIEARGVSICSMLDTFNKNKGRNKSFGRAMKALTRKENNWKINANKRNDETVERTFKIKSDEDFEIFKLTVLEELYTIDPKLKISILDTNTQKFKFAIPSNYPIKIANKHYRYKSQFRPQPANDIERELIGDVIFTEKIED